MQINENGHLEIGGADAVELAKLSENPIYVLDEMQLRENMRSYTAAIKQYYPVDAQIVYAAKALINLAVCKIVEQEELWLDVVSEGELYTALKAEFPPEKIFLHGNNKLATELLLALQAGVGRIVIDNFAELTLLQKLCEQHNKKVAVLVRVRPGVAAKTHSYTVTGAEGSKFGFSFEQDEVTIAIQKILAGSEHLIFKGLHVHIGSQILDIEPYLQTIEIIASYVQFLNTQGIAIEELNLGGGLGVTNVNVHTKNDAHKAAIENFIRNITIKIKHEFNRHKLQLPKLILEPGRSIVCNAGTTLYKIGFIKTVNGKLYAAVNGGMGDNMRPALYQAKYYGVIANKMYHTTKTMVKIVGKFCESSDVLIDEINLPELNAGDVLAIFSTGAYNYSMASNYNRLPIPGMLLVNNGKYNWIVNPQTNDDIVRNDLLPEYLG